ncbi:hypothetical protein GALMADRAFT_214272 [Galerina marginata CBS 339.88]|uniref:Uncharacterized protein n=1 Tax=Galerina marginata (strain CBS 339.88) TaxID=685588 RepID=A0A067SJ47_GALM3|nr:hypothetical protein GALMADRAFT_214272 [Galerina marginata CBS 339.88]
MKTRSTTEAVVMLNLLLFALIGIYCQNDSMGIEERDEFKTDYHRLVEPLVAGLVGASREVMVVGPECVYGGGPPLLVEWKRRMLWPERKGMHTCWNTEIPTHETNYDTRIDFNLLRISRRSLLGQRRCLGTRKCRSYSLEPSATIGPAIKLNFYL